MPKLSIVTTLYRSEAYVLEFYRRVMAAASRVEAEAEVELVFVSDGSPDRSSEIVCSLIEEDKRVRLVELSRRFGHHRAILVGLQHTRGDRVFLVDCDLEEDPSLLLTFHERMLECPAAEVVYGYLRRRRGGFFERAAGALFYRLMSLLADVTVPRNQLIARLMKRCYVDALLGYPETHLFIAGLFQLPGFHQVGVAVTKSSKGSTAYTVMRKLAIAVDAVVSFSNRPLVFVSVMGFVISLGAFVLMLNLIIGKLLFGEVLAGWTSVMVSIWFVGGLIITSIGVVGIYVGKIFIQVKNRPNAIIRDVHN